MFTHALTAAIFALFAQSALADVCSRTYAIKEGDWCDTISANKNVSTYQLAVINQGIINSECTNLIPGNTICLGHEKEDCSTTYVIKADDSCDNIASSHGLNSTILRMNNPQINDECNNIYVGEVICTSSTVQVPPAPAGELPAATIPAGAVPAVASVAASSALATPTPVIATPTPVKAASAPPAAATSAPTAAADEDEDCEDEEDTEDDEDLPFCDEI